MRKTNTATLKRSLKRVERLVKELKKKEKQTLRNLATLKTKMRKRGFRI